MTLLITEAPVFLKYVAVPTFAQVHDEIRRALLRRFPYAVFFVVEDKDIIIIGVFHGRRDPTVWKRRTGA